MKLKMKAFRMPTTDWI